MAPKLFRRVAPFTVPNSSDVSPSEWRITASPATDLRFLSPLHGAAGSAESRGVEWWEAPAHSVSLKDELTVSSGDSLVVLLVRTREETRGRIVGAIGYPSVAPISLGGVPHTSKLRESTLNPDAPVVTADLAVRVLPSWQEGLLQHVGASSLDFDLTPTLARGFAANLLLAPTAPEQVLLLMPTIATGQIEGQLEISSPVGVAPAWNISAPVSFRPHWDPSVPESFIAAWEIENPGCFSIPSVLGVPTASGKMYESVGEGRTERRIQRLRQDRERDAIRSAARSRRPVTVLVSRDLFELIRPILMPPLESDALDVVLMPQELFDYQRYGVKWLMEEPGRLLADDMGLGKTAQAITAFRALVRLGKTLNALVVCPASLMETWRREFGRWAPELRVFSMDGTEDERRVAWPIVRHAYHVVLTTYDRLRIDSDLVQGETTARPFGVVVFDEVQYLKNRDSVRRRAAVKVNASRRWGLSGTPMENRVEELNSVLSLLLASEVVAGTEKRTAATTMLRRRKDEARKDLPPLIRNKKYVELGDAQRRAYDGLESAGVAQLQAGGARIGVTNVLALITKLKQVCNGYGGESCKSEFLKDYMDEVRDSQEKALVFSQYKDHFDLLKQKMASFRPKVFTGSLSATQRNSVLKDFESDDDSNMLIMTLQSGGVGLTITAANHVIHYDSWWNPARGSQATARAHRIGQSKVVVETTLICSNTIEERIDDILQKKRALFADIVDDLADVTLSRVLTEEEFYGLFGLTSPRDRRP